MPIHLALARITPSVTVYLAYTRMTVMVYLDHLWSCQVLSILLLCKANWTCGGKCFFYVISRIDYCNTVFYGITVYVPRLLQTHATQWAHHTNTSWYIALPTHLSVHWIQDCADDFQLCLCYEPAYFHGICEPVTYVDSHVILRSVNYVELVHEGKVLQSMPFQCLLSQLFETVYQDTCVLTTPVTANLFVYCLLYLVCTGLLFRGAFENIRLKGTL